MPLPAAGPYGPDHYGSFMPVFDPEIDEVPTRVLFEGDGTGRRLKPQKIPGTWVRLPPEQQERPWKPGVRPDQAPGTHPSHRAHDGGTGKARQALPRGLTSLEQRVERGDAHQACAERA
ncbi:hypothetical protein ACFUIZ_30815 [Streptomyces cinereoruber]|uniref:hypothetical protein n=1 Tax=Streptomyces cinereoruber TaxID=67260 RepID=UPI00363FC4E1